MGLEDLFPGLRGTPYRVTSPAALEYNCIAWAAGVTDQWWWPIGDPKKAIWPDSVPREETLSAFLATFATLGYAPCAHGELEPGQEKVALYADPDGVPTHATRQLATGRWTSKIGRMEDIEHDLPDLEGSAYGTVARHLSRPARADEKAG